MKYAPIDTNTTIISTLPKLRSNIFGESDLHIVDVQSKFGMLGAPVLSKMILKARPDIVVVHAPVVALSVLLSGIPSSVPVMVVAHHPYSSGNSLLRLPITVALSLLNNRAVLHSAVSNEAARGEQCIGARRVVVTPLGGEVQTRDTAAVTEVRNRLWPVGARIRLLSLGRLEKFKNLGSLIAAIHLIRMQMALHGAFLCIVGSGSQHAKLTAKIDSLNLNHLIRVLPETSDPSVHYYAADCLVIPSLSEGGPITAIEAALSGTQILMTEVGLFHQLSTDLGDQIRLIPGTDSHSIAEALLSVIQGNPIDNLIRKERAANAQVWSVEQKSRVFYEMVRSTVNESW